MIRVTARPRIHLALADMGFVSHRAYGGMGFSIAEPKTCVEVRPSASLELAGFDILDSSAVQGIWQLIQTLSELAQRDDFCVTLTTSPNQHTGFGSKTSLALATITALNRFLELSLTIKQMQHLSGRGGASGVGIHTFFLGGFVADGGHARATVSRLVPSAAAADRPLPPLLLRTAFPPDWRVGLMLPHEPHEMPTSGAAERNFFAANAPIERDEALATIAALYHGVLPAFRIEDLDLLASSLRSLHTTGFKARELSARSLRTQNTLQELHTRGFAAGMSSMGPLIYVIIRRGDGQAAQLLKSVADTYEVQWLGVTRGFNAGHSVDEDLS